MRKVISNTTPIITLLSISKLEILKDIYGEIIIPEAVYFEIESGKNKSFYSDISKFDWINILAIKDTEPLKYLNDLDKGEADVIVLANELKADLVIIDERVGREYAKHFNLNLTGTVGILLKAKELGIIGELKPLLCLMTKNGIWLHKKLIDKILATANEK